MRARALFILALLLLGPQPEALARFLPGGGTTTSGSATNVIGAQIDNENIVPGAAIGTHVGHLTAIVTGGGPCSTCTWTTQSTNLPISNDGAHCTPASNNFQVVPDGSGGAYFEAAVSTLTQQFYGAQPSTQNFVCAVATPAVGSAYIFSFSVMVRPNVFTSVEPLTVLYTPSASPQTGTVLATMSATVHGTTPAPSFAFSGVDPATILAPDIVTRPHIVSPLSAKDGAGVVPCTVALIVASTVPVCGEALGV